MTVQMAAPAIYSCVLVLLTTFIASDQVAAVTTAGPMITTKTTSRTKTSTSKSSTLSAVDKFLQEYDKAASVAFYNEGEAEWTYNTNITDYNQEQMSKEQLSMAKFKREQAAKANLLPTNNLTPDQKRQLTKIKDIGSAAQTDEAKLKQLNQAIGDMESIYSKAKVCLSFSSECMNLDPGLTHLFETSRDYDKLLEAWEAWRDQSGAKMKQNFTDYVALKNEALKIAGHADAGDYWRSWYDTDTFEDDLRDLFTQIRPLYEQLHGFVRRKLKQHYGADKFPSTGHIPAHLLGNMWAQQWDLIEELVKPYPSKKSIDVTSELQRQNYTVHKMFQTADDFFASLGLIRVPKPFWDKSMTEKPSDGRDVVCHGSAWDFYNAKDFRIKMCTVKTMTDFVTIHHEMGHIQYYLQYKGLPVVYREGANPGFHEAVGDVMALSVGTPKHLHTIGLLPQLVEDNETDINFLMHMALEKIAFLPFGYLIDQWRWEVFRGDTQPDDYNSKWWDLRCRYQGISSPVARDSDDFDPGAKYHVASDVPYIRYFVSFVIQFQFHKAACVKAGNTGPLHKCDIYNSKAAGQLISNMLRLGSSKPWPEAMQQMTGGKKMDAGALMEYFRPLLEFLRKENGNDYGWNPNCPAFVGQNKGAGDASTMIGACPVMVLVSVLLAVTTFVMN